MHPRTDSALDLASTFVVIEPDQSAVAVAVTPEIFQALERDFDRFKGRMLVSSYVFSENWSMWEMHPAGDELVCLLSGDVTLVLDRHGAKEKRHLRKPGEFVIIPKGTWHTARTQASTKMLFLTPGEGTDHRPVDNNDGPD